MTKFLASPLLHRVSHPRIIPPYYMEISWIAQAWNWMIFPDIFHIPVIWNMIRNQLRSLNYGIILSLTVLLSSCWTEIWAAASLPIIRFIRGSPCTAELLNICVLIPTAHFATAAAVAAWKPTALPMHWNRLQVFLPKNFSLFCAKKNLPRSYRSGKIF